MLRNLRNFVPIAVIVLILIVAVVLLTGCQSGSTPTSAPRGTTQTQEAAVATPTEEPSPNGTWTAEGFVAEIGDDSITINFVDANGTTALYWKGTFPATGDTVVSKADVEALSMSMMGSTETEKTFKVDGDEISFPMSMMGVDTVIRLTR